MSSDLATNQISLLNSHPNPAHRKYERFACTIRIGLKYLSTAILEPAVSFQVNFSIQVYINLLRPMQIQNKIINK